MPVVMLDLDGTLHDRAAGIRRFASANAERLCPSQKDAFRERFRLLDSNGKVWKDKVYEQLRGEFASETWPSTDALVQAYIEEYPGFAVETQGDTELLMSLRRLGVRTAIVTNGRSDLQRRVVEALGFDVLADAVAISEEVGFRKPQRQVFQAVLDKFACQPADAVMIGDDPVADIEGAQSAGIHAIGFNCAVNNAARSVRDLASAGTEALRLLGRAA